MSSDPSKSFRVPPGALLLMSVMPKVTESALDPVLKLVNDTILKKTVYPKTMNIVFEKSGLNEEGPLLLSALCSLVNYLTGVPKSNLSSDGIKNLCKELKFSDECCNAFMKYFEENKCEIVNFKRTHGSPYFLKLENFSWRIDITLSSNSLAKSLGTVIIIQMMCKGGKCVTFELTIAKFHQLRFCVADMLREMERFEKKNALTN